MLRSLQSLHPIAVLCAAIFLIACGDAQSIEGVEFGAEASEPDAFRAPDSDTDCTTIDTEDECGEGCHWLVPGCGDNPLGAEGCFPEADCAEDTCEGAQTCQTVSHDPCAESDCDACGAEAQICAEP